MSAISPWAAAAIDTFVRSGFSILYEKHAGKLNFRVHLGADSLWILPGSQGTALAFRAAYDAGGLELKEKKETEAGISFKFSGISGTFSVTLEFYDDEFPIIRYTTSLRPFKDLFIPFTPRDILVSGKDGKGENTAGKIHMTQEGTRSGMTYFSVTRPKSGSVFYLQNLTALNDYFELTKTGGGEVVGGQWPEIGFSLPCSVDEPLPAKKEVIIADAFIAFSDEIPKDEPAMTRQFLDLLACLYLRLPKPEAKYNNWPEMAEKGLKDLIDSPGCWMQLNRHHYLNAYVSDYDTVPESMVQLAVLLPLLDYSKWKDQVVEISDTLRQGLPAFFDEKLRTIKRWLPAAEYRLKGDEEHKKPGVMDSWYLHHPMLNLSRLALEGDKLAGKLFLDSLEYMIKVAKHFDYNWPVFYKMETLEVIKAETEPGKGGEKDVPGLYAHVMLQAYELTGRKTYLTEAEKAAKKLAGLGFSLFYQANNTAFSAGALLRLWKITGKRLYLDLSFLCLANIFRNVQLWNCNYGDAKSFPSFFAVFPLSNAPYTAVYEEEEVFAALHDYLEHAAGTDILPSVSLLVAEFIRYAVYRAAYYYPPMLPEEILSDDVKVGEIDPGLWIPLEDMQDGWAKSGQVGQEVYGAGTAFGIVPRHYIKSADKNILVYLDYPSVDLSVSKKQMSFKVLGDGRLMASLRLIARDGKKTAPPDVKGSTQGDIRGKLVHGSWEYAIGGNQEIRITWNTKR